MTVNRLDALSFDSFKRPLERFGLKRQSQPNPLYLKLTASAAYLRNGHRQTHCDYLAYFQQLSLEERPYLSKRPVEGAGSGRLQCNRYAVAPSTLQPVVTRQRAGRQKHPYGRSWNVTWIQYVAGQIAGRFSRPSDHLLHLRPRPWAATGGPPLHRNQEQAFADESSSQCHLAGVVEAWKIADRKLGFAQGKTKRFAGARRELDRTAVAFQA